MFNSLCSDTYMKYLIILLMSFINCIQANAENFPDLRIVATEHNLLQYRIDDEAKGPTAEITKALLSAIDQKAIIEFMPWARAFELTLKRPNTLILSMIRTPEREKQFHWIGVVSELSRVFISLKSKPENLISSDAQAKEKIIAITRGSDSFTELINRGFSEDKNLYVVTSIEKGYELLLSGKVDLIYYDPNAIRDYIRSNKLENEVVFNPIKLINRRASYLALSLNSDKKLVELLKSAMAEYQKTEEYRYWLMKKG